MDVDEIRKIRRHIKAVQDPEGRTALSLIFQWFLDSQLVRAPTTNDDVMGRLQVLETTMLSPATDEKLESQVNDLSSRLTALAEKQENYYTQINKTVAPIADILLQQDTLRTQVNKIGEQLAAIEDEIITLQDTSQVTGSNLVSLDKRVTTNINRIDSVLTNAVDTIVKHSHAHQTLTEALTKALGGLVVAINPHTNPTIPPVKKP